MRIVNLGMDHHPIHLHGHQFVITGTEGGRAPESTWYPTNTVLVGVAQAKVVEFEAKYPGAWMVHCHLPHHMMNSMSDLLGNRAIVTADQAAELTLKAVAHGKNEVTFTAQGKLFVTVSRFFPKLVDWIAIRRVKRLHAHGPSA
jgi:hypothetical protein